MKILLTHANAMRRQYYGERALAALQALGKVELHEHDEPLTPEGLVAVARNVDVIVSDRMTPGPAEVFAGLPGLRAFLRVAVDIRNIDVEAASKAGVLVTRADPGFMQSVSEMALGYMIDLSRGISRSVIAYRAGEKPEIRMGRQLAGSTVGIIGFGSIGRCLADLTAKIGMTVLIHDPYTTVADQRFAQVDLDTLLAESHFVVCLVVANDATENLMDASVFRRMRPDAMFLNLSRGNLVNDADLVAALKEGRIAGAAMDVGRAPDQMPMPEVAALPNVVATPHSAGLTPPAIEAQAFDTVRQVAALAKGEVPPGAVNAEHWRRRL
jgi:D-3-phosphoglycerate dehydrogenase